ncbi:hypothetical protein MRX96_019330 [Rhipicephalus microplus]
MHALHGGFLGRPSNPSHLLSGRLNQEVSLVRENYIDEPLTTPLKRKEREIIESATSALSVLPNGTECTTMTTTEVEVSAEKEEEVDLSTATPTSDYEEVYQQTETSWVETSERISL